MIAVDTNVIIRLLTEDDRRQAAAAQALFSNNPVWIAKTVLLESAWVLRSFYGFGDDVIRNAFTKLLGLSNVEAEDAVSVARALELAAEGVDFADAMHLVSRPAGAQFVSFDRSFIRGAQRAGMEDVSEFPSK